ncbi:MAG TPA: type II toxin-antitoxin system VapB family antitoxin [Rhizomicrobium sp.]|jgi:antitoxin VapB
MAKAKLKQPAEKSADIKTAKLFKSGRSQAVRLPKEFRFEGTEVRVRRDGQAVVLEPVKPPKRDWKAFWADIDRLVQGKFMEDGRDQPPMPPDRKIFD